MRLDADSSWRVDAGAWIDLPLPAGVVWGRMRDPAGLLATDPLHVRVVVGRGYVVSDLSRRGVRVGFPHVCSYTVRPRGERACRLYIGARGRWTATRAPRPLDRAWLWRVLRATEARVGDRTLAHALWLHRRLPQTSAPIRTNSP